MQLAASSLVGRTIAWIAVLVAWCGVSRAADDPPVAPPVDKSPLRGSLWASTTEADHVRAGRPQSTRPHARTSRGPAQVGYYVGGGAAVGGESRDASRDGTWGVDYQPKLLPRAVVLGWNNGRKQQGGQGAYRTDGPKLRKE